MPTQNYFLLSMAQTTRLIQDYWYLRELSTKRLLSVKTELFLRNISNDSIVCLIAQVLVYASRLSEPSISTDRIMNVKDLKFSQW
jgi:hypothetical protein